MKANLKDAAYSFASAPLIILSCYPFYLTNHVLGWICGGIIAIFTGVFIAELQSINEGAKKHEIQQAIKNIKTPIISYHKNGATATFIGTMPEMNVSELLDLFSVKR